MAPTRGRTGEPMIGREPWPGVGELWQSMLWPKLFRSVSLAIRPERLLIAAFIVVLITLTIRVIGWAGGGDDWRKQGLELMHVGGAGAAGEDSQFVREFGGQFGAQFGGSGGWDQIAYGLLRLDVQAAAAPIAVFVGNCRNLWALNPWATLVAAPILLLIWGVGGCWICRIAACDFAKGTLVSPGEARNFAIPRAGSVVFAIAAPLALVGAIWLGLAVAGWVLFSLPGLNLIGGVFYVVFVLFAILGVLTLAAYFVGFPLLIPAVACEGADGVDAIGRAYPYVFGRPVRYAVYVLVLVLLGGVAVAVVDWAKTATIEFSAGAASHWVSDKASAVIRGDASGEGFNWTHTWAARMVSFWTQLLQIVAGAFVVSYFFCASTVLYLLMRRVCDGQDVSEIWMPGAMEATGAMTMEARAAVGGVAAGTMRDAMGGEKTGG